MMMPPLRQISENSDATTAELASPVDHDDLGEYQCETESKKRTFEKFCEVRPMLSREFAPASFFPHGHGPSEYSKDPYYVFVFHLHDLITAGKPQSTGYYALCVDFFGMGGDGATVEEAVEYLKNLAEYQVSNNEGNGIYLVPSSYEYSSESLVEWYIEEWKADGVKGELDAVVTVKLFNSQH
jgi:predicted RNase H-like HicB family nuclease